MTPTPGAMIKCLGCGFNREPHTVTEFDLNDDRASSRRCDMCRRIPDLVEAYRRGFNAGVEAVRVTLDRYAKTLRRPPWEPDT